MKKQLYITAGGKGGVGKTIALLTLADCLKAQDIPFGAIDADTENDGKDGAFGSYLDAETVNLRSLEDCDRLIGLAAENEVTLCDLPANAGGDIMPWFESVISPEVLEALDLEITLIGSVSPDAGSFASVCEWAGKLQDRVKYILVLNRKTMQRTGRTLEQTFPEVYATKTGQQFLKGLKPAIVDIEGLFEVSMRLWAKSGQLPSAAAVSPEIPILDRARVKNWVSKIHPQWVKATVATWEEGK